jgi:hypothetical protein
LQLGFDNLKLRGLEGAILEGGTYVYETKRLRGNGGGSGREERNVDVASVNHQWRDRS